MPDFAPYDPDARGSGAPIRAVIRPATHDDLDQLSGFTLAVVTRSRDDWAVMIDKSLAADRLLLVAEVGGRIVAFAQSHHLDEHPNDHGPAGFYLTGVTVQPAYRRSGLGRDMTVARLDWINDRADEAWYFASVENLASIHLHREFGFEEVRRASVLHGVSFDSGEGVLFRSDLRAVSSRRASDRA